MADLLLYISGMGGGGPEVLEPNKPDRDDDLINRFSRLPSKTSLIVKGWKGSANSNAIVQKVGAGLGANSPCDKLIVYGYSAGGVNALEFCRALTQTDPKLIRTNVDLLVTVDAAMGELSNKLNRYVPPNVKVCMNCWTSETTIGGDSHGGPAIAWDPAVTHIRNFNFAASDHATIRLDSVPNVEWEITKCLQDYHVTPVKTP